MLQLLIMILWGGDGDKYRCKYFVKEVLCSNDNNIKFEHLFPGASYWEEDIFRFHVTDFAITSLTQP